jgi:hypothetical protein
MRIVGAGGLAYKAAKRCVNSNDEVRMRKRIVRGWNVLMIAREARVWPRGWARPVAPTVLPAMSFMGASYPPSSSW